MYNDDEAENADQENLRWTFEECILFDNLLAVYGPTSTSTSSPSNESQTINKDSTTPTTFTMNDKNEINDDDDDALTRWDSIASMLPNKNPQQCQERYQTMMNRKKKNGYQNSHCIKIH